jgi:hypothetical protein
MLVSTLALAPNAAAQKWTKSTWSELGFKAEFPGRPTLDSSIINNPDPVTMMIVGVPAKNGYYGVMVTDMPDFTAESFADPEVRERVLDGAQNQSLADAGATLKSQREVTLDNRIGREIISTLPGGEAEIHSRIYLEAGRMTMQIAVAADKKALVVAARFLRSLHFL